MVVSAASSIGARVTGGGRAVTRHFLSPFFLSVASSLASHLSVHVSSRRALSCFVSPHLTSLYHISPGVTAIRPIFLRHKSHLVSLRPTLSSLSFSFSLFLFSIQTRQCDVVTHRFAASHMNLTQIENATYIQNNLFFLHLYNLSYQYTWFNNFTHFLKTNQYCIHFLFQFSFFLHCNCRESRTYLFILIIIYCNYQTRSLRKNMYIFYIFRLISLNEKK